MVHVQTFTKKFKCVMVNERKFVKVHFNMLALHVAYCNLYQLLRCTKKYALKKGINNFNFSCIWSHKSLLIHYTLWLDIAQRLFLVELCGFFLFHCTNCSTLYGFYAGCRQFTGLQKSVECVQF